MSFTEILIIRPRFWKTDYAKFKAQRFAEFCKRFKVFIKTSNIEMWEWEWIFREIFKILSKIVWWNIIYVKGRDIVVKKVDVKVLTIII